MTPRTATVAAVLALSSATVTTAALDANRPPPRAVVTLDAGTECVIPDCRRLTGRLGWDTSHEPVDCLATGPYAQGGAPVWRGCNVLRREYSTGKACVPARCSVIAGEDPLAEAP